MTRRGPYKIGFDHGLRNLPQYSHRHNGRRYDSANANHVYAIGYSDGVKQRQRDLSLPLFAHREAIIQSYRRPR